MDNEVNNIANTLLAVYQRLGIIVDEEIAEKREVLYLEWLRDSWEEEASKARYWNEYDEYHDKPMKRIPGQTHDAYHEAV
jgi:hypothetical protein